MRPVSMEMDGTGWDAVGGIQFPEQGFSPAVVLGAWESPLEGRGW